MCRVDAAPLSLSFRRILNHLFAEFSELTELAGLVELALIVDEPFAMDSWLGYRSGKQQ